MKTYPKISISHKMMSSFVLFLCIGIFTMPAMASNRFVDHGNGTVTDSKTGLMWAAKDNDSPINWENALSYCRNYKKGGHADWRLPTIDELASLYDAGKTNKGGYHITKFIDTSASSCWASETRGSKAGRFNFTYGKVYWLRRSYSGPTRVLPVRGGK